jgi:Putative Flp pilus-assembly TadE/G-like
MTNPSLKFRRLCDDTSGVTLVLVALTISALIGFVGLGVETGLWYTIKRQNQTAADFAALSGAYEIANGSAYYVSATTSGICGLASRDAGRNGFSFVSFTCPNSSPACTSPTTGQMCANNPPVLGPSAGDKNGVEIILAQQQNSFFASLFLPSVTIDTRAVAKVDISGVACSLSLDPSAASAVKFNGTTNVNLTNCGIAANSNSPTSMVFTGNTTFQAAWAQTVGNYTAGANTTIPNVQIDAFPVTDPYSCNPPHIGCAGQIHYVLPTTAQTFPTSGGTLQPGLYQKVGNNAPMDFSGATTWNLCPGIYYLDGEAPSGASFSVGAGATVQLATGCGSGGGVTIISTCSSPSNCKTGGGFTIASGATVKLSAPTSSSPSGCTTTTPYPSPCIPSGVLFYQDPAHADTGNSSGTNITANSNSFLTGAIYAPAQSITFNGNANSTCTVVIGLTLQFSGTTTMSASQAGCSAAGVTAPELLKIALSE